MDSKSIVALVFIIVVIGIPVLGITVRLAINPVVEAIVRLRGSFGEPAEPVAERRFAQLEAEVSDLDARLTRLTEEAAFEKQLHAGPRALAGELPNPDRLAGR